MRKSFERNLDAYKPMAQDQAAGGLSTEDQAELDRVIAYHVQRTADTQDTSVDTQKQVFDFQVEKQKIMNRLNAEIHALDHPEDTVQEPLIQNNTKVIRFFHEKFIRGLNPSKREIELSWGEIITDAGWGLFYRLDPTRVPRNYRKRYLIEIAKQQLLHLLDLQILHHETSREIHPRHFSAYQQTLQAVEEGSRETKGGMIAERMVRNFFFQLMLDHELDIQVVPADVHQDIEFKIDFIIRRKRRMRGVGVETHPDQPGSDEKTIGIQFTMNNRPGNLIYKQGAIDQSLKQLRSDDVDMEQHVDDLLLISLPTSEVFIAYDRWKANRTPGGPEKLWPPHVKELLFREALKGIFSPEEIDERWKRITKAN